MMKSLFAIAILTAFPLAAWADVTKDDVKKLQAAGVSEDVILAYVKANGPVAKLSTDDLVELKKAGVSDKLLGALTEAPAAPSQKPPLAATVEQNAYVTRPTYYYPAAPTYSYEPYTYSSYSYPSYSYPSYSYSYGYYGGHIPTHSLHSYGGHYSSGVHHSLGGHASGGHSGGGHHSGGHH